MKAIISKSLLISFLFCSFSPLFSQELSKKEIQDADIMYNYDGNYEGAAKRYEALLKSYPENANLAAKLGICYLNLDGKESEALALLLKASKNIAGSEKEYTQTGEKAPLDSYMYLAIAFHRNDSLQKAIALYNDAKKRLAGSETFREEYIDNQIRDCRYAIEMKKKPLTIISELFAPWLKEYPGACNPVLSKNDSVFIFTVKEGIKTRILCSYKTGSWNRPVDITKQLGGYDRFYSNSITGNGKQLIIYMDDGGDGNLYYSLRRDTTWSKIKSVGKPVNTIYWQSHGFITPDGNSIYFSSNKPGGQGELDIWYSKKNPNGTWSEPVNCGDVINTPYNEDHPYFDPTTGALLFSSNGHISMGGYDVFRSVNRNGAWTTPTGMPYAFNTSDNNTFFILNNNAPGFITSIYDEKNSERNIYSIVALDPAEKITRAVVTVSLKDGMSMDPRLTQILLADLKKGTQIKKLNMTDSSSFTFDIKPGDYQIFITQPKYKTDTINLNVPLYYPGSYISVNSSLVPEKVFEGDFLSIQNILFEFDSYLLNDQAISSLNNLKNILDNYPELTIEVAGYTDAKGSTGYNNILADKRAQAVIDYLISSGISAERLAKKSFGESNFVAINSNRDGSDNPEGRAYNRRATFGIVNPKTGVIIRQETYTPERLRNPNSIKYSIVLLKTGERLNAGYFSGLTRNEILFVRTIKTDSVSMYVIGVFYNKSDALKYLEYAREKGFDKAYISNQYELNSKSPSIRESDATASAMTNQMVYTVQVKATKSPLKISLIFPGIEGITEIKTDDGFYKYYYGQYKSLSKAKEALEFIKKAGFEDAFIRQIKTFGAQ
jgi:outer membrane protein OmpA-like peptidoglycan-associated protein